MVSREYLKTMVQLATTGFGLVAALAWNEAIKALFKEIFGTTSGIISLFTYAVIVTFIVVIITKKLGKLVEKVEEKKE
ncbi:hypothetical protein KKC06_04105 [Patescibacteria group bacterium]|nr:hypothetical protein [Patescibacteria group bacterium]